MSLLLRIKKLEKRYPDAVKKKEEERKEEIRYNLSELTDEELKRIGEIVRQVKEKEISEEELLPADRNLVERVFGDESKEQNKET